MTVSGVQRTVIEGNALRGAWLVTTDYIIDDAVTNGGETYVCYVDHTAAAADQPGVGANWEDFWVLVDFVASDPISYYPAADGMLHMPSGWTAASLAFLVAREPEGPYVPLYDTLGNIVEVTPAVDNTYVLPASLAGAKYVKLWSQTAGANVAQGANRILRASVDTGGVAQVKNYTDKILNLYPDDLITDWFLNELAGSVAYNAAGLSALDGAYSGVALNDAEGPDRLPVGRWDGAASYCDIYSPDLDAAFDGDLGTLSAWFKLPASAWTDSVQRTIVQILADGSNFVSLRKSATDNRLSLVYRVGGTAEQVDDDTFGGSENWINGTVTWDKAGNEFRAYLNGIQTGSTLAIAGTWAGVLDTANTMIGAFGSGAQWWNGWLSHVVCWNRVLVPAEVLDVATI